MDVKPVWFVQPLDDDCGTAHRISYLAREQGMDVVSESYVPFGGMDWKFICPQGAPVVFLGSINAMMSAQRSLTTPQYLADWADWKALRCSTYYAKWGSPPDEKTVTEKYRDEFAASCKKVVGKLSAKMKVIQDILDNKKNINQADRKVIEQALDIIHMELRSNMPFVHQQFDEAVEKTTTQAKGEIEAYWTHSIMAMGMKGIKDMLPKPEVIALEMDKSRPALTFTEETMHPALEGKTYDDKEK